MIGLERAVDITLLFFFDRFRISSADFLDKLDFHVDQNFGQH